MPAARQGAPRPKANARKLSYKEQRELDALPELIASLETEQGSLHAQLSDPDVYRAQPEKVRQIQARLAELDAELAQAFVRWEELEAVGS